MILNLKSHPASKDWVRQMNQMPEHYSYYTKEPFQNTYVDVLLMYKSDELSSKIEKLMEKYDIPKFNTSRINEKEILVVMISEKLYYISYIQFNDPKMWHNRFCSFLLPEMLGFEKVDFFPEIRALLCMSECENNISSIFSMLQSAITRGKRFSNDTESFKMGN